MDSLQGQLLIASPSLVDPNFRRTVVLVAEHGEGGAMGVVLNRPVEATVGEAVPPLAPLAGDDAPVFAGGPVSPEGVLVLVEYDEEPASAEMVFGDVGFMRGDADPDDVAAAARRARVFAGYAGWTAGQLESELEEEAWFLEPALVEDVFAEDGDLWSTVLARKGGDFRLLARMPADPSLN